MNKDTSQVALLRRFFFNDLVALQFGLDATLYLPTVYAFAVTLERNAPYYVSLTQLLPAAVQVVVSLMIGPIVGMLGSSLKWPTVVLVAMCAIGNFVYSCAGEHAIGSVWALIGGRMVCGLASGASSLSMAYLSVSTTAAERLPAFSAYRTIMGVALVMGPLLSIPLTTFAFDVGEYRVDGTNASTFVAAAIAAVVTGITAIYIKERKAAKVDFVKIIAERGSMEWSSPAICLAVMFLSSFLMADTMYLLSVMLTAPKQWSLGLTLASGLQAIVFGVSLLASLFVESVRGWIGRMIKWRESRAGNEGYTAADQEIVLSLASFAATVLGLVLVIVGIQVHNTGSLAAFLIGATMMMASYNVQASTLPSLYSKCIPGKMRVVFTPWYAAMVAAGKLAAPPSVHAMGQARGWVVSQIVCIGLGVLAGVILIAGRKSLSTGVSSNKSS